MNKKIIGVLLIAILTIVLAASLSYVFSQPNPNQNNPSPTPAPTPTPTPTPTPSPSATPTETASIPKPSVPNFTVELVDSSYDVPASYSIDDYTGDTITHEGYPVERRTIKIEIENQQFTPYTSSDGRNIQFYYSIRLKGPYAEEWTKVYGVEEYNAGEIPAQSNSEYTVIEYTSEGYHFISETSPVILEVTPDGEVDFQVQALIGSCHRAFMGGLYSEWVFDGEESGWSSTQTIKIP